MSLVSLMSSTQFSTPFPHVYLDYFTISAQYIGARYLAAEHFNETVRSDICIYFE